jgi:hypothetical protein
MATEDDEDESNNKRVSSANWIAPSKMNKKTTAPKRLFNSQKN